MVEVRRSSKYTKTGMKLKVEVKVAPLHKPDDDNEEIKEKDLTAKTKPSLDGLAQDVSVRYATYLLFLLEVMLVL